MRVRKRPLAALLLIALVFLVGRRYLITAKAFLLVQLWHAEDASHGWRSTLGLASRLTKRPLLQWVSDGAYEVVFEMRGLAAIDKIAHDPARAFVTVLGGAGDRTSKSSRQGWDRLSEPRCSARGARTQALDSEGGEGTERSKLDEALLNEGVTVFRCPITVSRQSAVAISLYVEVDDFMSEDYLFHLPLDARQSRLLSGGARPLRVAVVGDNQFAATRFVQILDRVRRHGPDALIHVGDAVQDARSARAWSTDFWRPMEHAGLLSMPVVMLAGNHDTPSFYAPAASRGALTLADGRVFLLVLSSQDGDWASNRQFIDAQLASDKAVRAERRIVLIHMPPFVEYWDPKPWSEENERDWNAHVRQLYLPVWSLPPGARRSEDASSSGGAAAGDGTSWQPADLVISGHQHNYQHFTASLDRPAGGVRGGGSGGYGAAGDDRHTIHYVTTGGAGGTLDHESVCAWTAADPSADGACEGARPEAGSEWAMAWAAMMRGRERREDEADRQSGSLKMVKTVVKYHYAILTIPHPDDGDDRGGSGPIQWTAYDQNDRIIDSFTL